MGLDRPPAERAYPPGYWLALVVGGYHDSGDYTHPPRDCLDGVARLERDGCVGEPQPDVLPGRLLTPDDLVVGRLDDTRRLVWAMTDHLSDGEAQGPVAIVEMGARGLDVRAIGVLRAFPRNISLRLERQGTNLVLVADGEYCLPDQVSEECARAVRLLPLIGDRFVPKSLVDGDGACVGRAFIPVRGAGAVSDDRRIRYRIETLVTISPESIVFREQLDIDRHAMRADSAKASYVTRVQADRQVVLRSGNLVVTGPSLLARWQSRRDKLSVPDDAR